MTGGSGGNGSGSTAKNGILRQLSSAPGTSRLQRITSMWTGAQTIGCNAAGKRTIGHVKRCQRPTGSSTAQHPTGSSAAQHIAATQPYCCRLCGGCGDIRSTCQHCSVVEISQRSSLTACTATCCTGMGASLAKDVPFAALYWAMLEPLRASLMRHEYSTLADSFWQNSAQIVQRCTCSATVLLAMRSAGRRVKPNCSCWQRRRPITKCLFADGSLAWCRAGNINELPVVPDVPALVRERTPAEILVINIAAAGKYMIRTPQLTSTFSASLCTQAGAAELDGCAHLRCVLAMCRSGSKPCGRCDDAI